MVSVDDIPHFKSREFPETYNTSHGSIQFTVSENELKIEIAGIVDGEVRKESARRDYTKKLVYKLTVKEASWLISKREMHKYHIQSWKEGQATDWLVGRTGKPNLQVRFQTYKGERQYRMQYFHEKKWHGANLSSTEIDFFVDSILKPFAERKALERNIDTINGYMAIDGEIYCFQDEDGELTPVIKELPKNMVRGDILTSRRKSNNGYDVYKSRYINKEFLLSERYWIYHFTRIKD